MREWLKRNKIYAVSLFVMIQVVLIAWYMSQHVGIMSLVASVTGISDPSRETEYILIYADDITLTADNDDLKPFYDLVFHRLINNEEGVFTPGIARSWSLISKESLDNGSIVSTWQIQIRDPVLFHNGNRLTMEDVFSSIHRMKDRFKAFSESEFRIENESTLVVATSDPSFLAHLASVIILPQDSDVKNLIGSGDYAVTKKKTDHDSVYEYTLSPFSQSFIQRDIKNTLHVTLLTSPYRTIAKATSHILNGDMVKVYNVPPGYGPPVRQYCYVSERFALRPVMFLKNVISREAEQAILSVIRKDLPYFLKNYEGSQIMTQFSSPGIEGYKSDINIYDNTQGAQLLSTPLVLNVYTDVSLVPLAASLGHALQQYQIALNIIPSENPLDEYHKKTGDLYLLQYDYRVEPSLLSFFKLLSPDASALRSELERIERIASPFERQEELWKLSSELGTKFGYPLFDTLAMDAVCNP